MTAESTCSAVESVCRSCILRYRPFTLRNGSVDGKDCSMAVSGRCGGASFGVWLSPNEPPLQTRLVDRRYGVPFLVLPGRWSFAWSMWPCPGQFAVFSFNNRKVNRGLACSTSELAIVKLVDIASMGPSHCLAACGGCVIALPAMFALTRQSHPLLPPSPPVSQSILPSWPALPLRASPSLSLPLRLSSA